MSAVFKSVFKDSNVVQPVVSLIREHSTVTSLFALSLGNDSLAMGDRVLLRMPAIDVRCEARFFGVVYGESALFVIDDKKINSALFLLGYDVYCEHNSDDIILAFKGKVKRVDINPFPCLYLSYPSLIQRQNVARDVRFNVDNEVLLRNTFREGVDNAVAGKLRNLSKGGGLVVSQEPVGFVGDEIEVFMLLPSLDRSVRLKVLAKVRHVRHDLDEDRRLRFHCGLQFMNLTYGDSLHIKSYLFDHLGRVPRNVV